MPSASHRLGLRPCLQVLALHPDVPQLPALLLVPAARLRDPCPHPAGSEQLPRVCWCWMRPRCPLCSPVQCLQAHRALFGKGLVTVWQQSRQEQLWCLVRWLPGGRGCTIPGGGNGAEKQKQLLCPSPAGTCRCRCQAAVGCVLERPSSGQGPSHEHPIVPDRPGCLGHHRHLPSEQPQPWLYLRAP